MSWSKLSSHQLRDMTSTWVLNNNDLASLKIYQYREDFGTRSRRIFLIKVKCVGEGPPKTAEYDETENKKEKGE